MKKITKILYLLVLIFNQNFLFSNILESDTAFIREKNAFKNFGQSLNFFSQWNNKYRTHFSISNYSYENENKKSVLKLISHLQLQCPLYLKL